MPYTNIGPRDVKIEMKFKTDGTDILNQAAAHQIIKPRLMSDLTFVIYKPAISPRWLK